MDKKAIKKMKEKSSVLVEKYAPETLKVDNIIPIKKPIGTENEA